MAPASPVWKESGQGTVEDVGQGLEGGGWGWELLRMKDGGNCLEDASVD